MSKAKCFVCIVGLVVVSACDSGSRDNTQAVTVSPAMPASVPSPPPLQGAPDPVPVDSIPAGIEVSVSETVTQTNIDAAPAQQRAASSNYETTSAVEAIPEEASSSDSYTATNTIQLIYRAG